MSGNFEEISVASSFRKVSRYLSGKWLIILFSALAGGLLAFFYAESRPPKYNATLTFVLSSETRSGGISGLASQLGFDMGNSGGGDLFAGDNILTLFKSRNMIQRALFKVPPGGHDILINLLVSDLKWNKDWTKQKRTKDAFPFPSDTSKLTGVQDSLIRDIHATIVEKFLQVARPDKKLSYYSLTTTSSNETFSFYLTRFLMDETARFYIETKTRLAKQNLEMVQKESDSLRGQLSHTITATAASVDKTFNLNSALQVQRAPIQRGQFNSSFLATAYSEVAKNVIIAKINLQKEMPLYQIIDEPTLPLKAKKANVLLYTIAGCIIFSIFATMFLLVRLFLKSVR